MPPTEALPSPPLRFARVEPEEEQDTSYLALSVRISKVVASNIRCIPLCRAAGSMPVPHGMQTFAAVFVPHLPETAARLQTFVCTSIIALYRQLVKHLFKIFYVFCVTRHYVLCAGEEQADRE